MSSRIGDAVSNEVVGFVRIFFRLISKGEMQDTHAGELPAITQCMNPGSHIPQVFRNKRKLPQRLLYCSKKSIAGSLHPATLDCGFTVRRNFPVFFKTAEMIQADEIHLLQHDFNPFNPPAVSVLRHDIPPVQGMPPALSRFAEIVRRYSGNVSWLTFFIQIEEMRIRPHIGAVVRYKNRKVPDDFDAPFVTVLFKRRPLPENLKLNKLLFKNKPGIVNPFNAPVCPGSIRIQRF